MNNLLKSIIFFIILKNVLLLSEIKIIQLKNCLTNIIIAKGSIIVPENLNEKKFKQFLFKTISFKKDCLINFDYNNIKNKDFISDIFNNLKSNINSCKDTSANSGSFFCLIGKGKYMIKSIKISEYNFFKNNHINFFKEWNIVDNYKKMLLYNFFIFKIQNDNYVILENLKFNIEDSINKIYDLKGNISRIDDKNFNNEFNQIKVKNFKKLNNMFLNTINFLSSYNLMDYSFLIIILYKKDIKLLEYPFKKYIFESENFFFIFVVIDFFQQYNLKKTLENKFLTIFFNEKNISSTNAKKYKERIYKFFELKFKE